MRISTNTVYTRGAASLSKQQFEITRTQEKISSGLRVNRPSDDPASAARILDISYAKSLVQQSIGNQSRAQSEIGNVDSTLAGVSELLQNARDLAMQANVSTISDADRKILATNLRGTIDSLTGLANSTDVSGQYIFGGFGTQTPPFVRQGASTAYVGDNGVRSIAVTASRLMRLNESGQDLFMNVPTGNANFDAVTTPSNQGTLVYNAGSVVDQSAINRHGYKVDFSVAAGATTYSVTDTTSNSIVASGQPFTATNGISFGGMSLLVSGSPANGDSLSVAYKPTQSIFDSLSNLATSLEASASTPAQKAKMTNATLSALRNIDGGLSTVSNARTSAGSRMSELESLTQVSTDTQFNYGKELSALQDLDYASAISLLTKQKQQMDAAQQSYAKLFGMSLMSYLK